MDKYTHILSSAAGITAYPLLRSFHSPLPSETMIPKPPCTLLEPGKVEIKL